MPAVAERVKGPRTGGDAVEAALLGNKFALCSMLLPPNIDAIFCKSNVLSPRVID